MPDDKEIEVKFNWINLLDVFVTIVIALLGFFALNNKDLAIYVSVFGALLVTSRLVLQNIIESKIHQLKSDIEKNLLPLNTIEKVFDLSRLSRIEDVDKILKFYLSITEPEFRTVKNSVLADTARILETLSTQKVSEELATSEYYQWLLPMLDEIKSGEKLRAVSIMNPSEWDNSPAEEQFFKKHINAGKRGVIIERIFIMDKDTLPDAFRIEPVHSHVREVLNGINGFFADKTYLQKYDEELLKEIAEGFIIIGDRVALVDRFSSTGQVRGQVIMNSVIISRKIQLFERLKISSVPLSLSLLENLKISETEPNKLLPKKSSDS